MILAISRGGKRIEKKIGDIQLKTGDVLLMEAPRNFAERYEKSSDFLLVSTLAKNGSPNYSKSWIALTVLAGMVFLASANLLSMFQASFLAAIMMLATGCTTMSTARSEIDWQVLLVIAASIGIGNALNYTGAANVLAGDFISLAGDNPYLALIATFLITSILTEMITNNAAAVLVFPIAISVANGLGVSFMPFIMVIIFAASASFATPIGYQTNLMVYGPGGYKFTDYLKMGIPLHLMGAIITLIIVPLVWPF
ncbi:MAG: SLC13 family permease [Balneolaceae bacterium]